jgi:hypothetical protein
LCDSVRQSLVPTRAKGDKIKRELLWKINGYNIMNAVKWDIRLKLRVI